MSPAHCLPFARQRFDARSVLPGLELGRDVVGVKVRVAATKLYFAAIGGRNLVLNATLRRTHANQFGLLGFGGDRHAGIRRLRGWAWGRSPANPCNEECTRRSGSDSDRRAHYDTHPCPSHASTKSPWPTAFARF